ncbi:MAG: rod shape-determining protein MreD [Gammaproteobacteria bacterium]|nr:MAG: rod shape-determining protein MreD [Gammaproteobacteria bacterium]
MKPRAHAYWVVLLSFALAAFLQIVPLPTVLSWWRPPFLMLVVVYWVVAIPHRVGLTTALLLGLYADVLYGAVLGQNALALVLTTYIALLLYQRFRLFALWQQAGVVLLMVVLYQFCGQWVQSLAGRGAPDLRFLLPAITSTVLWPWLFSLLRRVRRRFKVE